MHDSNAYSPYDASRHITAGQLRAMGFLMREDLPDGAYVSRVALSLPRDALAGPAVTLGLDVLEPFRVPDELVAA